MNSRNTEDIQWGSWLEGQSASAILLHLKTAGTYLMALFSPRPLAESGEPAASTPGLCLFPCRTRWATVRREAAAVPPCWLLLTTSTVLVFSFCFFFSFFFLGKQSAHHGGFRAASGYGRGKGQRLVWCQERWLHQNLILFLVVKTCKVHKHRQRFQLAPHWQRKLALDFKSSLALRQNHAHWMTTLGVIYHIPVNRWRWKRCSTCARSGVSPLFLPERRSKGRRWRLEIEKSEK